MRKILDESTCQIGLIANDSTFNGVLGDESSYYSDASLYDDDISEDEFVESSGASLGREYVDAEVDSKKKNASNCNGMPEESNILAATKELRLDSGIADPENFKELILSSPQHEKIRPKTQGDTDANNLQSGNTKRAVGRISGLNNSSRKGKFGRNDRNNTCREGNEDGRIIDFENGALLVRKQQVELGVSAKSSLFGIATDQNCQDVSMGKTEEPVESEKPRELFGYSRRSTKSMVKANGQKGMGHIKQCLETPSQKKRGRPRKVTIQESVLNLDGEGEQEAAMMNSGKGQDTPLNCKGMQQKTTFSEKNMMEGGSLCYETAHQSHDTPNENEARVAPLDGMEQTEGKELIGHAYFSSKDASCESPAGNHMPGVRDFARRDTKHCSSGVEFLPSGSCDKGMAKLENSGVSLNPSKRSENRNESSTSRGSRDLISGMDLLEVVGGVGQRVAKVGSHSVVENEGAGTNATVKMSPVDEVIIGGKCSNKLDGRGETSQNIRRVASHNITFSAECQQTLENGGKLKDNSTDNGDVNDNAGFSMFKTSSMLGSGTESVPKDVNAFKSRKGNSKLVKKSGEGKNRQAFETIGAPQIKTVRAEARIKHGNAFVKVGSGSVLPMVVSDAQVTGMEGRKQNPNERYKGKRKLFKGQSEVRSQHHLPAMTKAAKGIGNMQSKRQKSRSEDSNTASIQNRKKNPVITEKEGLPSEKSGRVESMSSGKNMKNIESSWKGQKKIGKLPKVKEESCENGNGLVALNSAGRSEGEMLDFRSVTKALDSDALPRNSGFLKQVKQSETSLAGGMKGTLSKGNKVRDENFRLLQVEPTKEVCASFGSVHSVIGQQAVAAGRDVDCGAAMEEVSSCVTEGGEGNKEHAPSEKRDDGDAAALGISDVGWVLCDDCRKWRCIPAELADVIDATNCRWSCQDNPNKDYADCSIPQEKSNAEINAELNISEVSFCEEGDDKDPPVDSKCEDGRQPQDHPPAVWTLIKHNIFPHRERKKQTIDEIMVCQCRPPQDGSVGCGDECLNRMLSIECVPGTCPCGDFCSNQRFQKRAYSKVGWFRCGKKGFGLRVLEDVAKGTFIIEYVGEVLDRPTYEARQKEYACRGQKHFYFMTLNSDEVIDACVQGNLGRFVNHSCEPNCTTEKWMVNGEVCIGMFAIRDLAKGEEITFDYNYVRVCGAAAKRCHCGSSVCRGFIGGDPSTPLGVVESDSEGEDPEPIMFEKLEEQGGRVSEDRMWSLEKKQRNTMEAEEKISAPPSIVKRKWTGSESMERQGSASKRVKTMLFMRKQGTLKGLAIETGGGRFEGVEEKLNELCDDKGGIGKRKEAAKYYLKLLVVTAASGDMINGEASRSTRDLSMVLDALLKTSSRSVLVDIINKNGLQILHNMIKQNRRNFKKIPIIRKLLKVLEFLATKHILTLEHINSKPPLREIESITDTIHELSRHNDVEVQQIARRFQEKWIPEAQWPRRKMHIGHRGFSSTVVESEQNNHPKSFLQHRQHQFHPSKFSEGKCWQYPRLSILSDESPKEKKDVSTEQKRALENDDSDEAKKRPRRKSRWDQLSKSCAVDGQSSDSTFVDSQADSLLPVLDFDAFAKSPVFKDHLVQSDHAQKNHASSNADYSDRKSKGSQSTSLQAHPVGALLPQFVPQENVSACSQSQPVLSSGRVPAVASGVPVGHFLSTASQGIVSQHMPICYGIPIALGQPINVPQSGVPSCTPGSQPVPELDSVLPVVEQVAVPEEKERQQSGQILSSIQSFECKNINFGVSHVQFFQQMQNIFGPDFHPWQLQFLMAPHSWGPYLSGDAEQRPWSSCPCAIDELGPTFEESNAGFEPEPPVPGLSPPRVKDSEGYQPAKYRHFDRGESTGLTTDGPSRKLKWEGHSMNRSFRFHDRKYHNYVHKRDYNYSRRYYRHSSPSPPRHGSTSGSHASCGYWENCSQNEQLQKMNRSTSRAASAGGFRANYLQNEQTQKMGRTSCRESKWDIMPSDRGADIRHPSYLDWPSQSSEKVLHADRLPSDNIGHVQNKSSGTASDAKEGISRYTSDTLEVDGHYLGEVHTQDFDVTLNKEPVNQCSDVGTFGCGVARGMPQLREAMHMNSSVQNFEGCCLKQDELLHAVRNHSMKDRDCQMDSLPLSHDNENFTMNEVQNFDEKATQSKVSEGHCLESFAFGIGTGKFLHDVKSHSAQYEDHAVGLHSSSDGCKFITENQAHSVTGNTVISKDSGHCSSVSPFSSIDTTVINCWPKKEVERTWSEENLSLQEQLPSDGKFLSQDEKPYHRRADAIAISKSGGKYLCSQKQTVGARNLNMHAGQETVDILKNDQRMSNVQDWDQSAAENIQPETQGVEWGSTDVAAVSQSCGGYSARDAKEPLFCEGERLQQTDNMSSDGYNNAWRLCYDNDAKDVEKFLTGYGDGYQQVCTDNGNFMDGDHNLRNGAIGET